MSRAPFGEVALKALAVVQLALGLAGLVASGAGVDWGRRDGPADWQRALVIVAFAGIAARLIAGSGRDRRVSDFGFVMLLASVFFAWPPIRALELTVPEQVRPLISAARAISIDALTPYFLWRFLREFPRALGSGGSAAFSGFAVGAAGVIAAFLICCNLALTLSVDSPFLREFDRTSSVSHYWTAVFALMLPAPVFLAFRLRRAPPDERQRFRVFVAGTCVGLAVPLALAIVPPISGEFQAFLRRPSVKPAILTLNLLSLLLIAATTSYAVLVQKILDVRTILRKAAQYALARLVIAALAGIPLVWLGVILYRARGEALGAIFVGPQAVKIVALVAAEIAVLQLRTRVMELVDRLFFREAYDARRVLVEVAEGSRAARSTGELVGALTNEVERALHPTSVALLVESALEGSFVALRGPARRLERDSALVAALAKARAPVVVDLERLAAPLDALPDADRVWLADAGAEALVPLVRSDGGVAGLLVLGPKQSELGYSRDDLLLLSAVGASAGLSLENLLLRDSARTRRDAVAEERLAAECLGCGRVEAADAAACTGCGGKLHGARLPRVLFDKFELEARVGEGAMGIVYRAKDLALGRAVALKTLPVTSPEDSVRLRREARAMASIRHPHLALIFGAETWKGEPILVLEYLARGTLADRLAREPLPLDEALRLGATLADVLDTVHGSGLLHRDVKPSNVGFTEEGDVKLLDFGLARIAGGSHDASGAANAEDAAVARAIFATDALGSASMKSGIAGTPLYMSPEALAGERADAGFDLWSLGVVIYEAATGRHPFERATAAATYDAIRHARLPRWDEAWPTCPPAVQLLFASTLSPKRSDRPASARDLARSLTAAAASIAA